MFKVFDFAHFSLRLKSIKNLKSPYSKSTNIYREPVRVTLTSWYDINLDQVIFGLNNVILANIENLNKFRWLRYVATIKICDVLTNVIKLIRWGSASAMFLRERKKFLLWLVLNDKKWLKGSKSWSFRGQT